MACMLPKPSFAQLHMDIYARPQPPAIDSQLQDQQTVTDIPGDASLVDETQWSNERAENVKDVTDYVPGVFAQPRDGA